MSISGARVVPEGGRGGLLGSPVKNPGVSGGCPAPPKFWETRLKSTPVPPYWLVYKTPSVRVPKTPVPPRTCVFLLSKTSQLNPSRGEITTSPEISAVLRPGKSFAKTGLNNGLSG